MIRLFAGLLTLLFASLWLDGCDDGSSGGDNDPFAVTFSVASVPRNLPLDSIEIHIAIGDTGKPQNFSINAKTGVSQATVIAYPGQTYKLSYKFFSGGFAIGKGELSGKLTSDMQISLSPDWDAANVDLADSAIHAGKYLPGYLGSANSLALAGKPLDIKIDSADGKTYRWWVRLGDSIIAEGQGSLINWTPAASLTGKNPTIKLQVLTGTQVTEETSWVLTVLASRLPDRLRSIVIKNDTAASQGSLIEFKYTGSGHLDSVLSYDTTAHASGYAPVASVAYSYQSIAGRDYVGKAAKVYRNDSGLDTVFTYDAKGRLLTVTVTQSTGTTVDSIFYGADGAGETRSYAQGSLLQTLKHAKVSASQWVDTTFSKSDSGFKASRVVLSAYRDTLLVAKKTWVNKGGLVPNASEKFIYTGLDALAIHLFYTESGAPELIRSETFAFTAGGLPATLIRKDETTQEVEWVWHFGYGEAALPAAKLSAAQVENLGWINRLSVPGDGGYLPVARRAAPKISQRLQP
jgi:YD repeat-containing protein